MRNRLKSGVVLLGALSLIAAACGDDGDSGAETTAAVETTAAAVETTAAPVETTAAPVETTAPAAAGGDLEGFKGTTPLTPLGDDFKTRLLEVDPALTDFNYAAEGYDLTTIIALAVAKAGDDGIAYASEIQGITRDGEKCTDYATCLAIIDAGGDPDFDGFSGPITLNGVGDPLEASYGVLTMGADNRIDDEQTVYLPANGADDADVPAVPVEGDRVGDCVL